MLLLVLGAVVGVSGGLAGGLLARQLDEQPAPAATRASDAAASVAPTASAPTDEGSVRAAVDRVLPAVVTVLADFSRTVEADGTVSQSRSVGSGVVISAQGHVITNAHVVAGAAEVSVLLASGEQRPATVVADDSPFTDLAVLSIDSRGLGVARWGDSTRLLPGEAVVAVSGSTFAVGNTVSAGVVSATGRVFPRPGVLLEDLVQTDASVNHGDSGGALVNLAGELVGIITTVVRETPAGQAVQGVSFAQSSAVVRPIVEAAVGGAAYPRRRLGIERPGSQHIELIPQIAVAQGLPVQAGALVIAPAAGSPAELAGVQPGDIVVALNGAGVDLDHPLVNLLKRLPPGSVARLAVVRGDRQLVIPVSPVEE